MALKLDKPGSQYDSEEDRSIDEAKKSWKPGGWDDDNSGYNQDNPASKAAEKEKNASVNDGQPNSSNSGLNSAEQNLVNSSTQGSRASGGWANSVGKKASGGRFSGSRAVKGGSAITVVILGVIFAFMSFFGLGFELTSLRENVLGNSPFGKIQNFTLENRRNTSLANVTRKLYVGDTQVSGINIDKFKAKYEAEGFKVIVDDTTTPRRVTEFSFEGKKLDLDSLDSKTAARNFTRGESGRTIRKRLNRVAPTTASQYAGKATRSLYRGLGSTLRNWLDTRPVAPDDATQQEEFARAVTAPEQEATDRTGRVDKTGAQDTDELIDETEGTADAEGNRTGGADDVLNYDDPNTQTSFDLAGTIDEVGLNESAIDASGTSSGVAEAAENAGINTLEGGTESGFRSFQSSLRNSVGPSLAGKIDKIGLGAGKLISVTEVPRIACRVKGTLAFISQMKNVLLAAQLAKFSVKILTAADHQKAGLLSGDGLGLLMTYMHNSGGYSSSGGVRWLMGDSSAKVGAAGLAQYGTGRTNAGLFGSIAGVLGSIPATNYTACKVYNNGFVQAGGFVVGAVVAVFSAGSVTAAQIGIGLTLGILEEVVFQVGTPLILKAVTNKAVDGLETGPQAGNAFASGIGALFAMIGGRNGMAPSTKPQAVSQLQYANTELALETAEKSFTERYFSTNDTRSLLSRVGFAAPKTTSQLSAVVAQAARGFGGTVNQLGNSVASLTGITPSVFAEESECQGDPQIEKTNSATDPFCNILVSYAPDLDLVNTEKVLRENGMIDANGRIIEASKFGEYVKECGEGRPGLLYSAEYDKNGASDPANSQCADLASNGYLTGDVAEAFHIDPLEDTRAWFAKTLTPKALAQETVEERTPTANERFLAWFGYAVDQENIEQEINDDYGDAPLQAEVTYNNKVVLIGDSLMVGTESFGKVTELLESPSYGWDATVLAQGGRGIWSSSCYDANGLYQTCDPVDGINVIEQNRDTITQSDTIVIALGTNGTEFDPTGVKLRDVLFEEKMVEARRKISELNPKARVYFVNLHVPNNETRTADRNAIINRIAQSSTLNTSSTVLDWYKESTTKNLVYSDGVHNNSAGYVTKAQFIASSLGQYTTGSASATNTSNCETIQGNERIICAALKYTGVRYANYNSPASIQRYTDLWGVRPQGNIGQNAKRWIEQREEGGPDGPTDFLECSGYVNVAVYEAFGVDSYSCSAGYLSNSNYRQIELSELRPGDLVIKNDVCGNNGHVGIFVENLPNGNMKTLESSAGSNANGEKRTGYYIREPGDFRFAARYIGPGSTP